MTGGGSFSLAVITYGDIQKIRAVIFILAQGLAEIQQVNAAPMRNDQTVKIARFGCSQMFLEVEKGTAITAFAYRF